MAQSAVGSINEATGPGRPGPGSSLAGGGEGVFVLLSLTSSLLQAARQKQRNKIEIFCNAMSIFRNLLLLRCKFIMPKAV
jgi:hypothetical protein